MSTYFGIFELHYPLNCKGDVVGKKYTTTIGDTKTNLHFPVVNIAEDKTPKHELDRFSFEIKAPIFSSRKYQFLSKTNWGRVYSYNSINGKVIGININSILVSFEHDDDDDKKTKYNNIVANKEKWETQLNETLDLKGKYVYEDVSGEEPYCNYFEKPYDTDPRQSKNYGELYFTDINKLNIIAVHVQSTDNASDDEGLSIVFDGINVTKALKEEYEIYLSGIKRYKEGRYRHAIMDAISACELAITKKIVEHCNELRIDGKAICKNRSLGDKFNFLKHIGVQLATENPEREIVKLRNDMFHARRTDFTKEECKILLQLVLKYLTLYITNFYE